MAYKAENKEPNYHPSVNTSRSQSHRFMKSLYQFKQLNHQFPNRNDKGGKNCPKKQENILTCSQIGETREADQFRRGSEETLAPNPAWPAIGNWEARRHEAERQQGRDSHKETKSPFFFLYQTSQSRSNRRNREA